MNHFAVSCKSKINSVHEIQTHTTAKHFLGAVSEEKMKEKTDPKLKICMTLLTFKINTGTDINVIS